MQKTKLKLPFGGQWLVFWGGDTKALNHHHEIAAQKYALDFVVVDQAGKTHKDYGLNNADYFCFGQSILASGDGEVVEVVDGVRDNKPMDTNSYMKTGNCVLIKHAENEFSFIAHLRKGSTCVKVGEQVVAGQKIGECGNSGNSSEPHLHYHLQDSFVFSRFGKDWQVEEVAQGIKAQFEKVTVQKSNQKMLKENYSPIKNDIVEPA